VPVGGQRSTKGTAMMRLIKLNLNHCTAAQDLLVQTVRERRVELALLTEPYRTVAHSGLSTVPRKQRSGGAAEKSNI